MIYETFGIDIPKVFLLYKAEQKSKSKIDPKCKKREYEKINKHTEYDKFCIGLRVQ